MTPGNFPLTKAEAVEAVSPEILFDDKKRH
jgi:hypothetical protein